FDATFEQHSEGATPALTGEVKYNAFTPAAGVLANDTDAEAQALTALLVSGPAHGSLTFNADGSFTYTPAPFFFGTDSFTYKANAGLPDSNTATVTINVTGPPPVVLDNSDSGYGESGGGWVTYTGPGYVNNNTRYAPAGSGGNTASWRFAGLPSGWYAV